MRTVAPIALLAALAASAGCAKKTEPGAPSPEGTPGALSDKDQLQGVWGVEWMDIGNGASEAELLAKGIPKEEVTRELDRLRQGRFEFKGDRATLALFGSRDDFTFALNESQNPKVMTLTTEGEREAPRPGTAKGSGRSPPQKLEWIYKFEGDLLVMAFSKGGPRPDDFKARLRKFEPGEPDAPGVTVLTLKKTNAPPKPDPGPRVPTTQPKRGTAK